MNEIRPFEPRDLPEANRLIRQLGVDVGFSQTMTPEQLEDGFTAMQKYPDLYTTLVAVQDGRVVGMISLLFYRVWLHPGGTALINELIVAQGYRGQGIGAQLIRAAIQAARARGLDEIEVGTERTNLGAQRFYKRCGFDQEYVLLGMEFE